MGHQEQAARYSKPGLSGIAGVVRSVSDNLRRWASASWERHKFSHEIAGLSDTQLDRVLSDFGLSRGELGTFLDRAPYSRELLDRMLARLKIDRDELRKDLSLMREIERQCAVCGAQRRCRRWLASADRSGYQEFCPNAEAFNQLITQNRG